MSIPRELYPSEDDLPYEEEILRNPFSLRLCGVTWWQESKLPLRNEQSFTKERSKRYLEATNSGKTKHRLWLELCDLLTKHATEVSGLNVDAIIRGGIRKFTDEVGRLWTSLADYYIRRKLPEKSRDVFEEGMMTVVTVRDFSVIFDAYSQFEESMLAYKMENLDLSDEEGENAEEDEEEEDEEDIRGEVDLSVGKFEKKILKNFCLHDDNDVDLRLARLEHLMDRRPELANSFFAKTHIM